MKESVDGKDVCWAGQLLQETQRENYIIVIILLTANFYTLKSEQNVVIS